MTRVLLVLLMMLMPLLGAAQGDRALGRVQVEMISPSGSPQRVELYTASHALIIGVSEYTAGWPKLPGVRRDVAAMRPLLERHGFTVEVVEDPTRDQLTAAIDAFIARHGNKPGARLVIYYAGHGHTLKLEYGDEMGYIVPTDAPNPNIDRDGFLGKAVDMNQIEVYARRIQSKHVLFLFDSCFSGSIFDMTRAVPENISEKTTRPVRQFITSGAADQTVPDRSIFREQLETALTDPGEADRNRDGYVTGVELGEYVQERVTNYSRRAQTPQYGKIRNPRLDKGDFVFELPRVAPATPAPTPEVVEVPSFDAAAQARERAEQRRRAEEARQQLLAAAKKAYDECVALEQNQYTIAEDRASAWREYSAKFEKADHQLAYARERAEHWRTWKAPTPTPRPTPSPLATGASRPAGGAVNGGSPPTSHPSSSSALPTPKVSTNRPGATKVITLKKTKGLFGGEHVTMTLVWIPGGKFLMGSPEGEAGRGSDEGPQREVVLDGFWMGETEVTQQQWYALMGKGKNSSLHSDDTLAVSGVSWGDAMEFCKRASQLAGMELTLPTEAQWEYGCRAGTTTPYSFGQTITKQQARFDGFQAKFVKTFAPNQFGLYDMHGNEREWCADWWQSDYAGLGNHNPQGPELKSLTSALGSSPERVVRGGNSSANPEWIRSASRSQADPNNSGMVEPGFRVVSNN